VLIIDSKSYYAALTIGAPVNISANLSHPSESFIFPQACGCGEFDEVDPTWRLNGEGVPVNVEAREAVEVLFREWERERSDAD